MKERTRQNLILVELSRRYAGRGIFWKNDTGAAKSMDGKRIIRFGCPGSPDIIGCLDGRFIGIEVKTPTGSQEESQVKFQAVFERAGGIYIIARTAEEAVERLEAQLSGLT